MAHATDVALDPQADDYQDVEAFAERAPTARISRTEVRLSIHDEIEPLETEWRAFAQRADATVFQTYEWLSTWQRHVGARNGTTPAIVVGRDTDGEMLFLFPLAVQGHGFARRLTWLGAKLCDYNAPMLARDFSDRIGPARFREIWADVVRLVRSCPPLRFEVVDLEQMPEIVGEQRNPMLALSVTPHRNDAYMLRLPQSWDELYARRSSATRRHDRSKRKSLAALGEVRFVSATEPDDARRTFETLVAQKTEWFAGTGIENMFAKPGYREFFLDVTTNPAMCHIAHVGRLDVGERTVATNLGLRHGDRYYHVLASYDRSAAYSRSGPGAAHLRELLRYAIAQGVRWYDLSVGEERFKREWCDTQLKLYDHLAAASLRGFIVALPLLVTQRVKCFIKKNPALWQTYRKARAFLSPQRWLGG